MHNAVVVVAAGIKHLLQPVAQRVFGIGVLAAIHMQAQVHSYQQVRGIAKLIAAIAEQQKTDKQKRKGVFEQPVAHVGSAQQGA